MSAAVSGGSNPLSRLAESVGLGRAAGARPDRLRVRAVAAGRRALVRVSGPLNAATAPALEEALGPYRAHVSRLILDLRAVEYIETPELRLLLALADELPARGAHLCLVVQPDSRVARTLQLAGMGQRCPFFARAREAWTARRPAAGPAPDDDRRERENAKGRKDEANETAPRPRPESTPAGPFRVLRPFAFSRSRRTQLPAGAEGDDHDPE